MPLDSAKLNELEYVALRDEILKRIELRTGILQHTLTVAGALLGTATLLQRPLLSAIYSPIALCLALLWAQNDVRGRQIGRYIATNLEGPPGAWEAVYRLQRNQTKLLGDRLSVAAPAGTLIATQVAAIALLFSVDAESAAITSRTAVAAFCFACLVATVCVVLWVRKGADAA